MTSHAAQSDHERVAQAEARLAANRHALWVAVGGTSPDGELDASVPWWAIARRALRGWWRGHPLHRVAEAGDLALRDNLAPVARRHPLWLLAGAAAGGAVLAVAAPRRVGLLLMPWLVREGQGLFHALLAGAVSRR